MAPAVVFPPRFGPARTLMCERDLWNGRMDGTDV